MSATFLVLLWKANHLKILSISLDQVLSPPSHEELAGPLLDAVYNETDGLVCKNLKGKEDVENTGTKISAEFLYKKCSDIQITTEKYDCQITSIITDNAKNMEKMRHELEQKFKNSSLITYGCKPHWLSLLRQDITPSSIMKHVVDIHKYFLNHHAPGMQ
ncbi:hypothetical protein TNCT_188691 [Trichonephila clavata]|uniref:DUF659 domain-containing protein n=1 Tax=Trichonephila clavata TaxID=2740835 RepID=A0A8X6KP96_TRICU|nr:hypothetical protein TNCT_188691 [Trichonephila clavata]